MIFLTLFRMPLSVCRCMAQERVRGDGVFKHSPRPGAFGAPNRGPARVNASVLVVTSSTLRMVTSPRPPHPGHDDPLDVCHNVTPAFALLWRLSGHQVTHVAGLHVGEDAPLSNPLQVVGDVVHHLLTWHTGAVPSDGVTGCLSGGITA